MTAQINTVFDPPLLTDAPETFDAKAQDMGTKLNPWAGEANTLATEVNANTLAAAQSKTDAQTAANTATIQAGLAAGAVAAAASTWVSEGSYTINQLSWLSPSSGALYRCKATHSGRSTPPDLDTAYWVLVSAELPVVTNLSLTYTTGRVTKVTEDGVETTITYNGDGTVNTVSYPRSGKTRTETFSYTAGVLTGMTASEA